MTGQKILVVEPDQLLLQTVAEKMLSPCGYSVLTAQDQETGFKLALSEFPDVLLLHLPPKSSANLLSNLAKTNTIIPTILVVEKETAEIEVKVFHLGVVDYIVPPLLPGVVQDSLDKVLGKSTVAGKGSKVFDDLDRINKELERYLYENNRILKISRSINSVLDLSAVLVRVTEAAVFVTEAEEGYLLLVDNESGSLEIRAKQALGQRKAQCLNDNVVNDKIANTVIELGKTVLLQNKNGNSDNLGSFSEFHSLLNMPLKGKDQIVGVLGVKNYSNAKIFNHSHIHQLSQVASIGATALENALKYNYACNEIAHYSQLHKFNT